MAEEERRFHAETLPSLPALSKTSGLTKTANNSYGSGGTSTGSGDFKNLAPQIRNPLLNVVNFYFPQDRKVLNQWLRYYQRFHPIVGAALDLHGEMITGNFYLSGIGDNSVMKVYRDSITKCDVINRNPEMIKEFFNIGESFPYLQWNETTGIFDQLTVVNPDYVHIRAHPFVHKPGGTTFEIEPSQALRDFVASRDPVDQELRGFVDPNILKAVQSNGMIKAHPFNMSGLLRKASPYDTRGTAITLRCFTPGTEVIMADGVSKPIEDISVGDKVITHKNRVREVTDTPTYDVDEDILNITVDNVQELIEATKDHVFFVYEAPDCKCGCGEKLDERALNIGRVILKGHGKIHISGKGSTAILAKTSEGKLIEKRAGDLKAGDFFVSSAGGGEVVEPEDVITPGKARLFGYFLAEGCYKKREFLGRIGLQFGFNLEKEKDTYAKEVQELLISEYGVESGLYEDTKHNGVSVVTKKGHKIGDNNKYVQEFFKYTGEYAHKKVLHKSIMTWPIELQKEIIRGFVRGDGNRHGRHAAFYTTSKALADQLQTIAARCGWVTTRRKKVYEEGNNRKPLYFLTVPGRLSKDFIQYVWGEYSGYSKEEELVAEIRKLRDEDKLTFKGIAERLNVDGKFEPRGVKWYQGGVHRIYTRGMYFGCAAGRMKPQIIRDGFWLRKIVNVETKSYKGKVHCLTVKEDHSFKLCSNLLTKNCLKDLLYEDILREAQWQIASAHVRPIWIYKLGDPKNNILPTVDDLRAFREVLLRGQFDPNFSIITSYAFQVENIGSQGKLLPLVPEFDWVLERVMIGLFTNKAETVGEGPCVSIDTRTLTENGFKNVWDIKDGEKIATFNPETKALEYHEPYDLVVKKQDKMIHFKHQDLDHLVTANHRCFVKPSRSDEYVIKRADEVPIGSKFKAFAENWDGEKPPMSIEIGDQEVPIDKFLKLLGIYVSEGSIDFRKLKKGAWSCDKGVIKGVTITQTKVHKKGVNKRFAAVHTILDEVGLGFKYSETEKNGSYKGRFRVWNSSLAFNLYKECGHGSFNKKIPKWVKGLGRTYLKKVLDSVWIGDGSILGKTGDSKEIYTVSPTLADDLMEICFKLGYGVKVDKRVRGGNRKVIYRVKYKETLTNKNRFSEPECWKSSQVEEVSGYNDLVYCFEVPNHLYVVERNGRVCITGNTYNASSVARMIKNQRYMAYRTMIETWMMEKIFKPIARAHGFYKKDGPNANNRIARQNQGSPDSLMDDSNDENLLLPTIEWQNPLDMSDVESFRNAILRLATDKFPRVAIPTLLRVLGLDPKKEAAALKDQEGTVFDPLYQNYRTQWADAKAKERIGDPKGAGKGPGGGKGPDVGPPGGGGAGGPGGPGGPGEPGGEPGGPGGEPEPVGPGEGEDGGAEPMGDV